jgi:ABC-type dipeptide/oligopeptide/nickel transport system ATPase component
MNDAALRAARARKCRQWHAMLREHLAPSDAEALPVGDELRHAFTRLLRPGLPESEREWTLEQYQAAVWSLLEHREAGCRGGLRCQMRTDAITAIVTAAMERARQEAEARLYRKRRAA